MIRREFIAGLGSAAAWPLTARAQQPERVRRIGVLLAYDEKQPVTKPRMSAFRQALAALGWIDGRNVRMDVRWHGGDPSRMRALAQELPRLGRNRTGGKIERARVGSLRSSLPARP